MRIAKLITWHWGTLEDREWPLAERVLLTGESGSGKSTLLDAIQTLLTAAHQHLVQFNVGQDESTQGRRGGKEPRTLAAYALGQQADGVFLRRRSTSYCALVFEPQGEEKAEPFTALVGVEAEAEGRAAKLLRSPLFFLLRKPLGLTQLAQNETVTPLPLKELYVQLQHRLQLGPQGVQRFEAKDSYLQHLYGALMGKTAVGEMEATRAAKSLVKAMAYKELGNVNELVRDEILEPHDFSRDLDRMRELMRAIAGLKAEAERLGLNLERLERAQEAAQELLDEARRYVLSQLAQALRARQDCADELGVAQRHVERLSRGDAQLARQLDSLRAREEQLQQQALLLQTQLAGHEVAREKQRLEHQIEVQADAFRLHWSHVQAAVNGLDGMVAQLQQLLTLELDSVPELQAAVGALRPAAQAVLKPWAALREAYRRPAQLDQQLPAFELEDFDQALAALEAGIRGALQDSLVQTQAAVAQRVQLQSTEREQRAQELSQLQAGRAPGPREAHQALALIEQALPQAHPHLLAQLVEPRPGSDWQAAIEAYRGGDRFALIVEAGWEARAARLVKQAFPQRSPKVVQGRKALEDTEGRSLEARAVLHELQCSHPVANAFLLAQYGRVRKVESEDELARTAQGLMQQGLGSRGYGMFSCRLPDTELAFGAAARQRRRAWCEAELERLDAALHSDAALQRSLRAVAQMFAGAAFTPLTPLLLAVLESQLQHAHASQALRTLDLSDVQALLDQQALQKQAQQQLRGEFEAALREQGALHSELATQRERAERLGAELPQRAADAASAQRWIERYATALPELASSAQLLAEAQALALEASAAALRERINVLQGRLRPQMVALAQAVGAYLSGARDDTERFAWTDPPRSYERLEELLPPVFQALRALAQQIERQRGLGLADNTRQLREAEQQFNHVFTSNFCFKLRDDVRQGAATLQRLNRHLSEIQFGTDRFKLEWDWVPRLQKVYEFFEAVEACVDGLERDRTSIFEAEQLTDEQRATAAELRRLLLANDQGASERALKELADFRNYRRYDIVRSNAVGSTRLSTWGTGSGGELETPFYVVRAAVLAHALGHFGRERREAPALRLMLSDEAFSKMDEARSRAVLRFLSQTLGLQLIVAMPTAKSGAVKPEFDQEYTFSKLRAEREGQTLFVSEAQEKTLHRQALAALWEQHAEQARSAARAAFEAAND